MEPNLQQDGRRYVKSAPEDYRYNCPWNDWTPPLDPRRRFIAAQIEQKRKSSINLCVRVRVCLSPYSLERGGETMIAFASVESDALGAKSLVLRRGSHILARMPLSTICIHQEHGYVRCTGFVDGDCLWDLSLGQRTGDGEI